MPTKTKIILFQYVLLVMILLVGFYSILIFKDQPTVRILTVLIMCFAYFLWGAYRHLFEKPFSPKIMIEYGMLSISVAVLLISILSLI